MNKILIVDHLGLRPDIDGKPDFSEIRAYILAKGGHFHLHSMRDDCECPQNGSKNDLHFYYLPELSSEADLIAEAGSGQYGAVIAAATRIPPQCHFWQGGVRIGAGTGNMQSASWNDGADPAAAQRSPLMNTPGINSRITAQMVLKALLHFKPDLAEDQLYQRVLAGDFDTGRDLIKFSSTGLADQRIAILGCGNIGMEVAKLARAFAMQVVIYAREHHRQWIEQQGYLYASTPQQATSNADVVTVHLGLGAGNCNAGLIDQLVLQGMAQGSVLINYDRGELVDVQALQQAMMSGRVKSAAIDADIFKDAQTGALSGPLLPYLDLARAMPERLLLLPHAAADTDHPTRVRGAMQAVDQIYAALLEKRVINAVGKISAGYRDGGKILPDTIGKDSGAKGTNTVVAGQERAFLTDLFKAAVEAADPFHCLKAYLPEPPIGRTVVIGAGKGAAQMAQAFERLWIEAGNPPPEGVVVTRYGYSTPCQYIRVLEAAHPVPDQAGMQAAEQLKAALRDLSEDDLVVALICGGGSALLPAPPEGLTLADEQAVGEALLASGAPISAMNTVRKHLSTVKGGRLAQLAGKARLVSLVVSDIPGDQASLVASGPTLADHSTRQDALEIIERYRLVLPDAVIKHLNSENADAPHPEDPAFARHQAHIIASAGLSLRAAAKHAEAQGVKVTILSDAIEGEARDIALMHAALAGQVAQDNPQLTQPVLLLSGGETTVTLLQNSTAPDQPSRGGRNSEFALSLALAIEPMASAHRIFALSADTDGIDGSEDNAGAFVDSTTICRMRKSDIDARAKLATHDSWGSFAVVNDLFVTGPTGTNVNDFRAILIR